MNSEITVYRQKKVDQLLRNLNRCNKILENIQKIDTYIQQQGGNVNGIRNLIAAVGEKRDAIKTIEPYSLPQDTVLVSREDIRKQQEIVAEFRTLAEAVSKLVNTQVKTQGGPIGASENPFGELELEIQNVETLKEAYKVAVKDGPEEEKTRIETELRDLGYEDDYFTQVQTEVTAERGGQEQGQGSSSTSNVSGPESQINNPSSRRQTSDQTPSVTSNVSGSQSQSNNPSRQTSDQTPSVTSNVSGSQSQTSNTSSNQRTTTNPQGTRTSDQRPGTSNQTPRASNQTPRASNQTPGTSNQTPGTSNQTPRTVTTNPNSQANKYFYQNYY